MKLKKTLIAIGLALLLSGGAYGYAASRPLQVELDENRIMQSLDAHFPIHKDVVLGIAGLDLDIGEVDLQGGTDRVSVVLAGNVQAAGKSYPGQARVSFGLEYEAQSAQLYLTQPKVESFSFANLPDMVSQAATHYLLPMIQDHIERVPVYQLREEASFQQMLLRRTLKDLQVREGKVVLAFGL
ncbi:MAG: DUF1439 domain-containing protein [Candidatus Sericytochromatia bacterium]